ncbi:MAG: VWA domain-containing protein [Gloeotrichia echinulata GP01]
MPENISVILVIDTLATEFVQVAKRNIKALIDTLEEGDRFAIVAFDTNRYIFYPDSRRLATISNPKDDPETNAAKQIINALVFNGEKTSICGGLEQAIGLLKNITSKCGVVLLSDGWDNAETLEDVISSLTPVIPVFTSVLGPASNTLLLREIAEKTGGEFYLELQPVTMMQISNKIRS